MKGILVFLAVSLLLGCIPKVTSTFIKLETLTARNKSTKATSDDRRSCFEAAAYIPDTLHRDHMPERLLRVNFHFMNSSDSTMNFKEDDGKTFIYRLLPVMQMLFDKNTKLWLPAGNEIPVIPVNVRYVLTGDEVSNPGIYFHYDDDLYYYIHMGARRNNTDRNVIEKYAVGLDSVLNIFILPHHPDSTRSTTYKSGCVGIALGNAIKISGIFEKGFNEWNVRGTFNHEVGHVLGLYHAWTFDGCEDTPMHDNRCWVTEDPGCQGNTSNNMMDYNAWQSALSPCQVGIINKNFSNTQNPVRNLLIKTWCNYDPFQKITIKDSIVWAGARDLSGDIEVLDGGLLHIKCRVSMAEGAVIRVHPGGRLILDDCQLDNDCGKSWNGILVMHQGKLSGEVIKIGEVRLGHAADNSNATTKTLKF